MLSESMKVCVILVSWDNCDYKAVLAGNLKKHVKTIHEGVRYPCDKCDQIATRKDFLKNHRKSKHQGWNFNVIVINIDSIIFFICLLPLVVVEWQLDNYCWEWTFVQKLKFNKSHFDKQNLTSLGVAFHPRTSKQAHNWIAKTVPPEMPSVKLPAEVYRKTMALTRCFPIFDVYSRASHLAIRSQPMLTGIILYYLVT